MWKKISTKLQYVLPQQLLSVLAGKLAHSKTPWLKDFLINQFIKKYKIDLSIAELEKIHEYETFNLFFTRQLKSHLRPIASDNNAIIAPVDGTIAQIGNINQQQLLQAKNYYFSLESLLVDKDLATLFTDGSFATLYLAPHNYHRVHMPIDGKLTRAIYIPGKLFSVNQITSDIIPGIYSRNERLVCLFETKAGSMAVIFVGALVVGNISTTWHGYIRSRKTLDQHFNPPLSFKKGDEIGHFQLGSTVIIMFKNKRVTWVEGMKINNITKYGQIIAEIVDK